MSTNSTSWRAQSSNSTGYTAPKTVGGGSVTNYDAHLLYDAHVLYDGIIYVSLSTGWTTTLTPSNPWTPGVSKNSGWASGSTTSTNWAPPAGS